MKAIIIILLFASLAMADPYLSVPNNIEDLPNIAMPEAPWDNALKTDDSSFLIFTPPPENYYEMELTFSDPEPDVIFTVKEIVETLELAVEHIPTPNMFSGPLPLEDATGPGQYLYFNNGVYLWVSEAEQKRIEDLETIKSLIKKLRRIK